MCKLLPQSYIAAIESLGLLLESDAECRADVVVGRYDGDIVFQPSPLQLWRGRPITTRKQRSLDTLFTRDDRCALLILGEDTALEVLSGAPRLLTAQRPIVAIRTSTTSGLASVLGLLRQATDYEWLTGFELGLTPIPFPQWMYAVAVPSDGHERLAVPNSVMCRLRAQRESRVNKDLNRLLTFDRGQIPSIEKKSVLIVQPTDYIAGEGLYPLENLDGNWWRWGGIEGYMSALLEPRGFGYCELRLHIVHSIPGAIDAITHVAVNGRPVSFRIVKSEIPRVVFHAFSETPFLLRVGCSAVGYVGDDSRRLSLAFGQLELRYKCI